MMTKMRAFAWASLLVAACGGEPGASTPPPTACGVAGPVDGAECAGLDDCGAGASNFREVTFCETCPWRPETHVCEAGRCVPLGEGGRFSVSFSVPASLVGARSFTLTSFGPRAADGTRLDCAALTSTCELVRNATLPVGNSNHLRFSSGVADPTLVYTANHFDYAGAGRLLFLQLTDGPQGTGAVIGHACAEGLEVRAGEATDVTLSPVAR